MMMVQSGEPRTEFEKLMDEQEMLKAQLHNIDLLLQQLVNPEMGGAENE